jgi:hypothetical protein
MSITKLTTNGIVGSKYDTVSADNYYMEPIATTLLGGTQATITFSGIPQTYKHLQLRIIGRSTRTGSTSNAMTYTFNGSATGYGYTHRLYGQGSGSGAADAPLGSTYSFGPSIATDASTSGIMGVAVMDILDYANVYKFKTTRILGGHDNNGSGEIYLTSGLWQNTAAITSISLSIDSFSWTANSRFSLYGIRG